ncbi:MAG: lamin tail domain-containing protein [Micromonosporaceae bacterium]|nr:lamin tail domain-containing protein [Micromonosporaceae bacterium]
MTSLLKKLTLINRLRTGGRALDPRARVAVGAALVLGAATLLVPLLTPGNAAAASADVVISQVYGGGGNSGATLTNDFIELSNRGAAPVDLTGWSVQYASAAGTSWAATALSGSLAPGAHYLIQEAAGAGGSTPLPTPDASGSIAMSATSGKVALATVATALSCGATCSAASEVRDFIGYGTANDFETAAAPVLSNTTADLRADGAADTDNNAVDFTAGTPDPRNSGGTSPSPTPTPTRLAIHEIQGAAHRSPVTGELVSTGGVVTAVASNGFWIQDPAPDADPATSEGLHVFTSRTPTVAVGDAVTVSGTVGEFRPGGSATNLTTTELDSPQVTVTATGVPLPAPTRVGPGGLVAPVQPRTDAPGDIEKSSTFDIGHNALDFYESLEGMLVEVDDAVATGPTNSFGETPVIPGGTVAPRSARGGVLYSYDNPNTARIILSSSLVDVPAANVGDSYPGPVTGILDYNFSNWMLDVVATPTLNPGGLRPETTRRQLPLELSVATYNVQNLAPTDPQAKFDRLAAGLVTNLAAPDIVSLEEIQDNSGATDDGTVAANLTLDKLVAAIRAAGGPAYQYREIDPVNDTTGGAPGGNIRVAFLFRTDRGVSFVDKPGGDATTPVGVQRVRGQAQLTVSPGLIDPGNAAWSDSRRPLVAQFRFLGRDLIVVGNHFTSKGGDDPLMGRFQPPERVSEAQRHLQAAAVRGFVDQVRAADPGAAVVLLGDLNDFEFSQTADILVGDGYLTDLPRTLPASQRYSYVFEGNSQVLDHILVSQALACEPFQYDIVHVNSEFTDQTSDHDPQVVRFPLFPLGGLLGLLHC